MDLCQACTSTRLLEACLHSLLSFLTSNFPSNPLLPDPLFSIERLSRRPVASSCAISCYAQVLRAAHLHRRAAGIVHQPYWLKSKGRRTPGRPARGPQDAQREDPRTPSARTPGRPARGPQDAQREDPTALSRRTHALTTCHPPGSGQSHQPESCVGPWTHGHGHVPPGPSNCKSLHSHGDALHISCGTCWSQHSGPRPPFE
ncbi:uncharacterized protein LOC106144037 isoform X2 [Microtus ochrogaster]|uniref:Uncharacterized protein LOC106144037 isoform X2 n=1 Tax=Microtus ochrogaster TaxID=79684 RepID=A0ABM1U4H7_MICOH|nr:uncharacterized protein LOC106144037 isoform X2 [Microtus ochrogaster]